MRTSQKFDLKNLAAAGITILLSTKLGSPTIAMETSEFQQRIDIVAEWYETRDYEMLAEELDWQHAPGFFGGETLTARTQVETDLTAFYFDVFDNIEVEIQRIEASDSSVFSFGTYLLTPKNSTNVFEAPFIHVWTIDENGRLAGLVQYADTQIIANATAGARVLSNSN